MNYFFKKLKIMYYKVNKTEDTSVLAAGKEKKPKGPKNLNDLKSKRSLSAKGP